MTGHGGEFTPLQFERIPAEESVERSAAFVEMLRRRRSVRAFSPEPVPFEVIENAIRAAGTGPSGANQQPWRYVVVQDPNIKRRIRAAAKPKNERVTHTE